MQHLTTRFPVPTPRGKKVFAAFDPGELTTDAGIAFIRSVDDRLGLTASLAPLLPDPRNPLLIHHPHLDLLRQRVYAIIAGYEDTNDATKLRSDPALKLATGRSPFDPADDLAGQPSLCRFEHRITAQSLALMQMTFVEHWLAHRAGPEKMLIDMDSTWDETHGAQQLTFFNGHYDSYGYHPLLAFDAETGDLIVAHLRPGNVGAAEGALALLEGIVESIRAKWPEMPILFRADGGFATPDIYDWCEANAVDYAIGLPINKVLERLSADCLAAAKAEFHAGNLPPGEVGKAFKEFRYKAESWKKDRCVIAKAEHGGLGPNQRYVVTNLKSRTPRKMYEFYCERGPSENWIKNLKNAL
ncbi:MAG: IS1380 family transposase, partial [Candidatus Sericytochromatia bacterium]|nr:IS1380 family transposase [Candidatus Tanganyikabacteria bacterium]